MVCGPVPGVGICVNGIGGESGGELGEENESALLACGALSSHSIGAFSGKDGLEFYEVRFSVI